MVLDNDKEIYRIELDGVLDLGNSDEARTDISLQVYWITGDGKASWPSNEYQINLEDENSASINIYCQKLSVDILVDYTTVLHILAIYPNPLTP